MKKLTHRERAEGVDDMLSGCDVGTEDEEGVPSTPSVHYVNGPPTTADDRRIRDRQKDWLGFDQEVVA